MSMPRRAVVLALVLGLAAHAHAACDKTGTFTVNMVTTGLASDPVSKCLSAMTLAVTNAGGNCSVTLTPTAADGNFVPAVWGSSTDATNYYTILQACPTDASIFPGTVTNTASAEAAIKYAINHAIYGAVVPGADVDAVVYAAGGKLTASRATDDFVYAIIDSDTPASFAIAACDGSVFVDTDTCVTTLEADCDGGKYGIEMSGGDKICALCPAGTSNDGSGAGCMPCSAGNYADSVGSATCGTLCPAGTYAEAGASDCQPCSAGTFSGSAGAGVCSDCPDGTYSFIPGSTACLFCVAGVPKCKAGNGFSLGGAPCTTDTDAVNTASVGYSVLTGATTALKAGLTTYTSANSYAKPSLFDTCTGTPKLALTIGVDCSVDMVPITDTSCSEPGASGYSYNGLAITGYYDGKTAIRSLLPTNSSGIVRSYLLSITPDTGSDVVVSYWAATNDPATGATFDQATDDVVSNTLTVNGKSVVGSTVSGSCPTGTYVTTGSCLACPTGYTCDGSTQTTCTADQYNQYVGATTCSSCTACRGTCTGVDSSTCSGGTCTGMTSYASADYCTIPWYDTSCGAGQEYDAALRKCMDCERGTAGTGTCTACLAGTMANVTGLATCYACTGNTVAPVDGLSGCETCPIGSITSDQLSCDPCTAGTYSNGVACVSCPDGYYRTGDATPENNLCKPIPAGYRERMTASDPTGVQAAVAKSEIVPCERGTISSWNADPTNVTDGAVRTPAVAQSTTCSPCSGRMYAPRVGMQQCLACKAGTVPTKSSADTAKVKGNDQCSSCLDGTDASGTTHNFGVWGYRDIFTDSDQCSSCPGGRETGPSNHAACTPCRPGYFMGGTTQATGEFCTACAKNRAQPLPGQTSCSTCGVGEETFDEGNTVCSKCAKGYYNPTAGQSCRAAPAGAYVNATGASAYSACPVGSFSNEKGTDWCDLCPPGQYANTIGSKACKTCPAGTFSSGGASSCKACSQGYYAPSGSSICSPCKAGFYTSVTKSSTCSACPKGNQCPLIGTKVPSPCKAGYYASKEGSKICTPCPVNTFNTGTAALTCSPCGAGTSTRGLTGQSKCQTIRPTLRRSLF